MRIIAYAWHENASTSLRVLHPLNELQARRGHTVMLENGPERLTPTDAELDQIAAEFDVAFLSRYHEPEAQQLMRRLKAAGLPVVWDHDDDSLTACRQRDDPESREWAAGLIAMLELADVVTTTNDRLADRYLAEGARYVIPIPNYLPSMWAQASPRSHDGIVLGYMGWADHKRDWVALGLEATVRELLDAHPDLRVQSVGPIDLELPEERWERAGDAVGRLLSYEALPPYLADFDFGLAPLRDSDFNHSRSDVKLKEYAAAGIPWLASATGPYEDHGEEQGGRLVGDDEWYEEIDALIRDKRARRKLAKQGRRWVRDHTLARNLDVWEDAFLEAIDVAADD